MSIGCISSELPQRHASRSAPERNQNEAQTGFKIPAATIIAKCLRLREPHPQEELRQNRVALDDRVQRGF